jgi:hypothetical protein
MNIADLDFLTPGSVFSREDGRESRLLFLTNTALPKKLSKQFPPQVVYADENNNILSCDIERFLNKRKFYMVDPELEARLVNLLAISNSDSEDALDLDSADDELVIEDAETDEGDGEDPVAFEGELGDDSLRSSEEIDQPVSIEFVPSGEAPTALDATYLAQAVSSYQQAPGTDSGSVQHSLFIRAEPGINRDSLIASFSPSVSEKGGKSCFTFKVELEGIKVHVDWDEFLGVYPCVFYGNTMYQVIFSTVARPLAFAPEAETSAPVVTAEAADIGVDEAAADAELAEIEAGVTDVVITPQPTVAVVEVTAQ